MDIFIIPENDILFINDVNKDILDLENLKYLKVERLYKDEYFDFNKKNKKQKINGKEYKIKFNFKNLEKMIIQIRVDEDFSFISDYFNLDKIYDTLNKKGVKTDINKIHTNLRESLFNYKFNESLKYFEFLAVTKRETEDDLQFLVQSFKMKKSINDLKLFTFKFT